MHRSPSPYQNPSSQPHPNPQMAQMLAQQYAAAGVAQVGPGSITYKTTYAPDGTPMYQAFKAVAASYQTPNGIVSGIQWIPAEPTTVAPAQGGPSSEYTPWSNSSSDWSRSDDKRRMHDDKESKRRNDDYDLQRAREKDSRGRRKSVSAGGGVPFPGGPAPSAYPTHPSATPSYPNAYPPFVPPAAAAGSYGNPMHSRQPSNPYPDLSKQFGDMDVRERDREREREDRERQRRYSTAEPPQMRSRSASNVGGYPINISAAGSAYGSASRSGPSPNVYPIDIPGQAGSAGYPSSAFSASPNSRNGDPALGRSTTPYGATGQVYPKGHVLEGQPVSNGPSGPSHHSRSRAPSPNPIPIFPAPVIPGKSPRVPPTNIADPGRQQQQQQQQPQQLPAPEAFSRPINASNTFSLFDPIKIENMNDLHESRLPKFPTVLTTHDVYPEDWKRCMQDLTRSWSGTLPVVGSAKNGRPPRPPVVAADLINLWNASYFHARGVELLLCKGRERRTGRNAGQLEQNLPHYESFESSSESSSETDLSDYLDNHESLGRPLPEIMQNWKHRAEERKAKRRRRRERRARRKERAFTVYVLYTGRPGSSSYGPAPGRPTSQYGSGGYPAAQPQGYGIQSSHSRGGY